MTGHRQVEPGGFIRTETTANILLSLRLIQSLDGPAMTMVAGAPGIGKTRTMRFIADEIGDQGSVYLSVAKGEGNPWNLATALLGMWNVSQLGNDLTRARQNLADCIGPRQFLLIDEAQHFDQKHKKTGERGAGFEWLRALAEEAGCRMVLCGDLTLVPMIDAFPQLQSRMRRPVIIKAASKADVVAITGVSGIRSDAAIEALYHVARHRVWTMRLIAPP